MLMGFKCVHDLLETCKIQPQTVLNTNLCASDENSSQMTSQPLKLPLSRHFSFSKTKLKIIKETVSVASDNLKERKCLSVPVCDVYALALMLCLYTAW